jgi:hypothetical protein
MILGIMVCVTLIIEALEYVELNSPSFHNVCLEIMLFNLFIPGRVIQRRLITTQNSQRKLGMLIMAPIDRERENIQSSQNLVKMA